MPSTLIHKRAAGGSSTKPFLSKKRKAGVKKILSSFDRTAKKLIKRLVALEVQALDPEIKVCGLPVKEADVKYMMRRMAKRVKKLEADRESLRKSNSELTARVDSRTAALERAQTARDLWRRTNRDQEQAAIAEKAELQQKINALDNENEELCKDLKRYHEGQTHFEELDSVPMLWGEYRFVTSPVEDTHACAVARKQALRECLPRRFGRMSRLLIRSQSVYGKGRKGPHIDFQRALTG